MNEPFEYNIFLFYINFYFISENLYMHVHVHVVTYKRN